MEPTDILNLSPAWPTVGDLPLPQSSAVGPTPGVELANSSTVHIAVTHHSDTATQTSTALMTSRLALSETPAMPILLPVVPSASTFATSTVPLTTPSTATSSQVLPQNGNHDTSDYPFNYPSAPARLFIAIANPLFVAVLCLAIFAVARSKFVREREKAAVANGEPVSAVTTLRRLTWRPPLVLWKNGAAPRKSGGVRSPPRVRRMWVARAARLSGTTAALRHRPTAEPAGACGPITPAVKSEIL
ncbi:hypothetical protein LTR53_006435 [Teratosphaeriaceae sp. CCFEE 6253]|nr:hypothetical protein LTR53_006435 [Teratosphaeriaceae sp. CCFEE 6253]